MVIRSRLTQLIRVIQIVIVILKAVEVFLDNLRGTITTVGEATG